MRLSAGGSVREGVGPFVDSVIERRISFQVNRRATRSVSRRDVQIEITGSIDAYGTKLIVTDGK